MAPLLTHEVQDHNVGFCRASDGLSPSLGARGSVHEVHQVRQRTGPSADHLGVQGPRQGGPSLNDQVARWPVESLGRNPTSAQELEPSIVASLDDLSAYLGGRLSGDQGSGGRLQLVEACAGQGGRAHSWTEDDTPPVRVEAQGLRYNRIDRLKHRLVQSADGQVSFLFLDVAEVDLL